MILRAAISAWQWVISPRNLKDLQDRNLQNQRTRPIKPQPPYPLVLGKNQAMKLMLEKGKHA